MARQPAAKPGRRGVLDPRLLRYARVTRTFIVASIALGSISALLIVAQAWLLADVIAGALDAGKGVAQLRVPLEALLAVVVVRALVAWAAEVVANGSSARCKQQLRAALLERVSVLGTNGLNEERTGATAVLATRGIDALDGFFSLYLPQVALAVIVPVTVLVVVLDRDWISALIIAVTLPLVPLFMALVGAATRDRTDAQLQTLQRLAGHFLDIVAGLATLKVFGRAKAQTRTIREVSERYRISAMATLRITFLSSVILELLATISVALVAVAVGLRLLDGDLSLRTALLILVLAPEAYLPLRALGANYHASEEGISAAEQVFAVLETPVPPRGRRTDIPDPAACGVYVEDLTVAYPARAQAALERISLYVEPGEVLAVTGPSGSGKSTLLSVLLGFIAPDHGSVHIGDSELVDLDPDAWRSRVSWVPQRPHLFAATIGANIRLGRPDAPEEEVWEAVVAAGLGDVVASRPGGLDSALGDHGSGLSAGERQRVALARAFLRDAPLLLLDEPTANLDGETEEEVLRAVGQLVRGRTVILVAHRPALIALADRVFELDRGLVAV